ncbi:MAG: nickel-binding protein, partial [Xenococcus sp. (in: cyanobacteria)]
LECIAEHNGTWKYSLLSNDRHQMICIFEAPDVESMRESYQRGGTFFDTVGESNLRIILGRHKSS